MTDSQIRGAVDGLAPSAARSRVPVAKLAIGDSARCDLGENVVLAAHVGAAAFHATWPTTTPSRRPRRETARRAPTPTPAQGASPRTASRRRSRPRPPARCRGFPMRPPRPRDRRSTGRRPCAPSPGSGPTGPRPRRSKTITRPSARSPSSRRANPGSSSNNSSGKSPPDTITTSRTGSADGSASSDPVRDMRPVVGLGVENVDHDSSLAP